MGNDNWVKGMRDELTRELKTMSKEMSPMWQPFSKIPQRVTAKQRVNEFLALNREQRLQMVQQMGPEAYGKMVMERLDDLSGIIGPNAYNMLPYFSADTPGIDPNDPSLYQADMIESLQGDDYA